MSLGRLGIAFAPRVGERQGDVAVDAARKQRRRRAARDWRAGQLGERAIDDALGDGTGCRVFGPRDADETLDAVSRVIANPLVSLERDAAVGGPDGRHHATVHQRHIVQPQIEGGKGLVQLVDEGGDLVAGDAERVGSHGCGRLPRAGERTSAPRHEKERSARRPRARRAPRRRRCASGDEVHRLQERQAGRDSERREQAIERGSGGVDRQPRGDVEFPARPRRSRARTPMTRLPSTSERDGLHVIRQRGAVLVRGERETEGQAIGLDRDVVVPDGGGRQTLAAEAGKSLRGVVARHQASPRQSQRVRNTTVSIERDEAIQEKPGAHGHLAGGDRSIERQDEGQRSDRVRRDSSERGTLPHRLARAPDVERLQIPETAVDRPEMIEGGAGAEIVALDERHRQAALRRVVRDRQAVDAAADDEDVERTRGEAIEIADHEDAR